MSGYTIRSVDEVPDAFEGRYPGSMRFLTGELGAEQLAFTHRLMPPKSGGKGAYGHRHKTQEEIYYVISGKLQFKLDDDIVTLPEAMSFASRRTSCARSGTTAPTTPS